MVLLGHALGGSLRILFRKGEGDMQYDDPRLMGVLITGLFSAEKCLVIKKGDLPKVYTEQGNDNSSRLLKLVGKSIPNIVTVGLETSEINIKHEKRPDFENIVQPWK
jgi:hypothetical protein